jgi:hypothetical protein
VHLQSGGVSATAAIFDVSAGGLRLGLDAESPAVVERLLASLRSGGEIELLDVPENGRRTAHVAWLHETPPVAIGLRLTEPLRQLPAGASVPAARAAEPKSRWGLASGLGAALLLTGIPLLLVGVGRGVGELPYLRRGLGAQATVTELKLGQGKVDPGSSATEHWIQYKFQTAAGQDVESTIRVPGDVAARTSTGSTVRILYLPENPTASALEDEVGKHVGRGLMLGGAGLLATIVGALLLAFAPRRRSALADMA